MGYTIKKADLKANGEEILGVLKRNLPGIDAARFNWLYEKNPAGPAACFLVYDDKTCSAVGSAAIIPRRLVVRGAPVAAGILADFVMDQRHRTLGPAISLQKAVIAGAPENGFSVLYGMPNKLSVKVLLKAGYMELGTAVRMTRPLSSEYQLRKIADIPYATRAASAVLDLALRTASKEARYRRAPGVEAETLTAFDRRFDSFWEKARANFGIIGVRDSEYLNWRLIERPGFCRSVFALVRGGSEVLGYVAYYAEDGICCIEDVLSADMGKGFDSLLSEFVRSQRKTALNSVSVSFLENPLLIKRFRENGFFLRASESRVIIGGAAHGSCRDGNWYFTAADNDA